MKLQIVSDLHMEFSIIEIDNAGADVLVLSGDICVAEYFARGPKSPYYHRAQDWWAWFGRTCSKFEHVIYALGNHEHYHGNFYETTQILRDTLGHIENLHILDNEFVSINDVLFFGTTLWTDFDYDSSKARLVQHSLNDYKVILGKNYRKLAPVETQLYHQAAVNKIRAHADNNIVVIGHHAPSYASIAPKYVGDPVNAGYASNLDGLIYPSNIRLWTHGHCHSSSDYLIGDTRVVANPRGYANDPRTPPENLMFDPNLVVEI